MTEKINTLETEETAIVYTTTYFTNAFNHFAKTATNLRYLTYTFNDLYKQIAGEVYMMLNGSVSAKTVESIVVSHEDMKYLKFLRDADDICVSFEPVICGKLALRLLRAIEAAPMEYDFTPYGQFLLSRTECEGEDSNAG